MAATQTFLATPAVYGGRANIIASPFQFLFTGEDNLRIVVANSLVGVVVGIRGRFQPLVGQLQVFEFTLTPTADRAPTAANFPLGAGYLLNVSLIALAGAPIIGQTFVMARLMRGITGSVFVLGNILAGYVTGLQFLSYPGSPIESSIAGGGYLRFFAGTDPPGAAEITETVPTGARWELISCLAPFTVDANVGDRTLRLQARDSGGLVKWNSPLPAALTASQSRTITWAQGLQTHAPAGFSVVSAPIPANQTLLAGDQVGTQSSGLFGGDGWGPPQITVREWLEVA